MSYFSTETLKLGPGILELLEKAKESGALVYSEDLGEFGSYHGANWKPAEKKVA